MKCQISNFQCQINFKVSNNKCQNTIGYLTFGIDWKLEICHFVYRWI